jgi:hypothetical protein
MVEALLEERRGYVVRGLIARVAQIDAQLKALGVAVTSDELETADATPRKRGK